MDDSKLACLTFEGELTEYFEYVCYKVKPDLDLPYGQSVSMKGPSAIGGGKSMLFFCQARQKIT